MEEFDVFIAGGAVAGPVAAKFCSIYGFKTLLIEKFIVPREKPCSGIQFKYFERIIGDEIPKERLCNNTLKKVRMELPNGKGLTTPFGILNFMRKPFDEWLCRLAEQYGTEFRDGVSCSDIEEVNGGIIVTLKPKDGESYKIKAKYVIDATGLRPFIRRKLKPDMAYETKSTGATLNYYFTADGDIKPNLLYQFWNIDFNNMMFAWVYSKTLDDGKDYWVVGTGYDQNIKEHQEIFFEFAKKKFNLTNINIVKKEGYSANLNFEDKDRIWLGVRNFLMVGDAAGLIDVTRGVGMDAAALSGRLAAKAIMLAEKKGTPVIEEYSRIGKNLFDQTRKNQARSIMSVTNNDELMKYMIKNSIKMGIGLVFHSILNKFKKPENLKMLPP